MIKQAGIDESRDWLLVQNWTEELKRLVSSR
jgi:hypothetical protein